MSIIEVEGLSKRFGSLRAVDDLSFRVEAGTVVGFLGPNGSGKTTTLRMLLDQIRPTAGRALIAGRPYREFDDPLGCVGTALETTALHPGRSGRDHLRILALQGGLPRTRVEEVIGLVGLGDAATRCAGGYSLGIRQRLALAGALLGDPDVLVLDEPANGLDPEGVRWLRNLLRSAAARGKAVLVSSHVLAEVAQTVDEVVIIDRGRLIAQAPLAEIHGKSRLRVRVRTSEPVRLEEVLRADGNRPMRLEADLVAVDGLSSQDVGRLAARNRIVVHELGQEHTSLEEAYLKLTAAREETR